MFCQRCGRQNQQGTAFCVACGNAAQPPQQMGERSFMPPPSNGSVMGGPVQQPFQTQAQFGMGAQPNSFGQMQGQPMGMHNRPNMGAPVGTPLGGGPVRPDNNIAMIGMILGFIQFVIPIPFILAIAGIICSCMGISRAKKLDGQGMPMAVTGLIVNILILLAWIGITALLIWMFGSFGGMGDPYGSYF